MNTGSFKTWALVGPGAVGLNYGGLLAANGEAVHVLARSDAATLKAQGLTLTRVEPRSGRVLQETAVRPASVAEDAARIGPADCVLIAAKTTVNDALVEPLRTLVRPGHTTILTLQNGMGNAEFYARHFPDNPVLAGLCFVCVNRVAPGVVENYHPGRVEIGSLGDRWPEQAQSAVAAFQSAGVKTVHAASLDAALWRKLCWNVPFNGLAIAAGAITCDQILADPALKARASVLMQEVQAAAAKAGHCIEDSFLEGQFAVTAKMGAYQPSSLIDYVEQRPVEVEAIWGEPLRRGEALGLPMPELAMLYREIKEAVERRS
ncbi:MAG: 2-dehydropantoate 2-reductase [Verrucomicrobia bacterium]|jgi:2-dehydropantoate 2-reductase|nr:2-dehydropantoate 2-reductase [Verrucomicrobiota bacterium]